MLRSNKEGNHMAKYLFYLVSGYLWQILLYTSCKVEPGDVPVYLFVILWILLSLMTTIALEELERGIKFRRRTL